MNFKEDITLEIRRCAEKLGYDMPFESDFNNTLLDYFTVHFKQIPQKRRVVQCNPVFLANLINHEKKNEIEYIAQLAYYGGNLSPFQSTRSVQARNEKKKKKEESMQDYLSNQWNIHHFHLSIEKQKRNDFVVRSKELLFAYIDDTKVILLGTDTHRFEAFSDIKWLEILHDFFPEVIEDHKSDAIDCIIFSNKERLITWEKGINSIVKVRSDIYTIIGNSQSCSGHSSLATRNLIYIERWLEAIIKQLETKFISENKRFKIVMHETLQLIEETTNTKLLTYPNTLIQKENFKNIFS